MLWQNSWVNDTQIELFSFLYAQCFHNMKLIIQVIQQKWQDWVAWVQGFKNEKYFCTTKPLKETGDQELR